MDTKQKKKRDYGGFVYVLKDEHQRRKIGLAQDVDQRVKELQTGNAERITIEHRMHVSHMQRAEKSLHELFAAYRLRTDGEWFDIDEKELLLLRKVFRVVATTEREEKLLKSLHLR